MPIFFTTFVKNKNKLDIKELIKDLLLKHKVVVLPGIGGFVTEYEEAKVDTKENKLSPPRKNVKFDTNLIKDENALVEKYLINTYKITQDEAEQKLKKFIDELKEDLLSGTVVEIKNIGYLKTNNSNEIVFESKVDKNLLLDSLGFEAFSHKTFNKSTMIKKEPKITKNTMNEHKNLFITKPYFYIPVASILLIVLLILFTDIDNALLNLNFTKNLTAKEKNKGETIEILSETDLSRSLDEQTDPSVALKIDEENDNSSNDKYANCTEFIIIAGSFNQFKYAEDLRQQLVKKGHDPEILLSEEKKYRVALKSFDNRQTALKELDALKEAEKNLNLWLLSI